MTLYERLSMLAKKQKISIPQLSVKLGFSEQYLYKWKTNTPKADNLAKVADYFNVSTDYLLGRTDDPNPVRNTEGYFRIDKDGLEGQELSEYIDDVAAYAELRRKKLLERKTK